MRSASSNWHPPLDEPGFRARLGTQSTQALSATPSKQGAASKASRKAVPAAIVFFWLPFQTIQQGYPEKETHPDACQTNLDVEAEGNVLPRAKPYTRALSATLSAQGLGNSPGVKLSPSLNPCVHRWLGFQRGGGGANKVCPSHLVLCGVLTHASTGKHGNNPACSRIARCTGQV